MKKIVILGLAVVFAMFLASPVLAAPTWDKNPEGFVHGLALDVDGETWYFAGPGSVMEATDVPGHTWVQTGPYKVKGRHYNVGPWMAPPGTPWWATEEPYGVLLFMVDAIVDEWSLELGEKMAAKGYVHYHELVNAIGDHHPTLVVWLKHTAVRSFYFNGGPMAPMSNHYVSPGVDYNFMPNWNAPYSP